jgi:hypothetical protein
VSLVKEPTSTEVEWKCVGVARDLAPETQARAAAGVRREAEWAGVRGFKAGEAGQSLMFCWLDLVL